MPQLFNGRACFSGSVPEEIQAAWVTHGGSLADNKTGPLAADYVFCHGRKDRWYPSLAEKAMPIFHAQWVMNVVTARFPVPIAPYALNSRTYEEEGCTVRGDLSDTVQQRSAHQSEERPTMKARRSLDGRHKRHSGSFDEEHSAMTLVGEQSLESIKPPSAIPYIDLTKIPTSGKTVGSKLRIHLVSRNKASSSKTRLSSSCVTMSSGPGCNIKPFSASHDFELNPMDMQSLGCLGSKPAKPSDIFSWTRLHSSSTIENTWEKPFVVPSDHE